MELKPFSHLFKQPVGNEFWIFGFKDNFVKMKISADEGYKHKQK
jgi:hypothetical protein